MEAPLHQSPVPLPPAHVEAVAAVTAEMVQQAAPLAAAGATAGREQCPRCASHDTKFCYYNNYNTAQPRHFCRACRRYWTLGGSLRNVPIGGSTRKRPRPARPTRAAVSAAAVVGPFASPAAPPPGGLLGSLLGSSPLLALGAAPLLEGRLGFDLGLGLPGPTVDSSAGDVGPLGGFGGAPLLWPTRFLESDHTDTWKVGASPTAVWQELAAPAQADHHGATQLL